MRDFGVKGGIFGVDVFFSSKKWYFSGRKCVMFGQRCYFSRGKGVIFGQKLVVSE